MIEPRDSTPAHVSGLFVQVANLQVRCAGCGLDIPYVRADWDRPLFLMCFNPECPQYDIPLCVPTLLVPVTQPDPTDVEIVRKQIKRDMRKNLMRSVLADALKSAEEESANA